MHNLNSCGFCLDYGVHFSLTNDPRVCPNGTGAHQTGAHQMTGAHIGAPLHAVVQWFKTMTTNEYICGVKQNDWRRFDKKLWQRNYWEYIIRNENEYTRIAEYIIDNPAKWNHDKLNPVGADLCVCPNDPRVCPTNDTRVCPTNGTHICPNDTGTCPNNVSEPSTIYNEAAWMV